MSLNVHTLATPPKKQQELPLELIDFEGYWIASYGNHGLEVVEIEVRDHMLTARKVTGDPHVPGGEISFQVDLSSGSGRIQIAEKGFQNPEWAPGKITRPYDYNSFNFEWAEVSRRFTRVEINGGSVDRALYSRYVFKHDNAVFHRTDAKSD